MEESKQEATHGGGLSGSAGPAADSVIILGPDGRVTFSNPSEDEAQRSNPQASDSQGSARRSYSETALKESEERFRSLIEAAASLIVVISPDFKILEFNPEAERLYGCNREEVLGKDYLELFVPEEFRDRVAAVARKVLGGEPTRDFQDALVGLDGERRIVSWNLNRLLNAAEQPSGLIAVGRDITEHKRAEQVLKDSELKYRSLVDMANDAIFVADIETGILVDANKRAAELIGLPVNKIIGMHQSRLHPPEEGERYRDIFVEYAKKGGGVARNLFVCDRKGRRIPVDISAGVLEVAGKKVLQGIFRDMTEAKRIEKERKRAKELSDGLNGVNSAINSTLDFSQIMQRVVVRSTKTIGSETGVIYLRENGSWVLRHVYRLPKELLGLRFSTAEAPLLDLISKSGRPVASNDAYNDERLNHRVIEKYQTRSFLGVPLAHRGEVIGILLFEHHSQAVPFTEAEADFAAKIAASVSLAVENARLYSAERKTADILQRALLTVPQRIDGLDFGYLYRSATEAADVGGDFYDLFELDEGRVGIIVGDVSGKGLEAASLTSLVKNTIRAYAYHDHSPASVVAKTNDVVLKAAAPSVFVTLFFGILDVATGKLTYCAAGHPEAIVKRGVSASVLPTRSPAVGTFEGLEFRDQRARLEKGDILLLYTDGVTEARCAKEGFFGEERLVDFVSGLKSSSPKELPQRILEEISCCPGCALTDDVVILAVSPTR